MQSVVAMVSDLVYHTEIGIQPKETFVSNYYDNDDAEFDRRERMAEMGELQSDEKQWPDWVAKVKTLLGLKSLDGDQLEDGYCLAFAYDHFEDGMSPEQYAESVRHTWDSFADQVQA